MTYNADDVVAYMTRLVTMPINDDNYDYILEEGSRLFMWAALLTQAYKTLPPKDLQSIKLTLEKLNVIQEGIELLKQNLVRFQLGEAGFVIIVDGED